MISGKIGMNMKGSAAPFMMTAAIMSPICSGRLNIYEGPKNRKAKKCRITDR